MIVLLANVTHRDFQTSD